MSFCAAVDFTRPHNPPKVPDSVFFWLMLSDCWFEWPAGQVNSPSQILTAAGAADGSKASAAETTSALTSGCVNLCWTLPRYTAPAFQWTVLDGGRVLVSEWSVLRHYLLLKHWKSLEHFWKEYKSLRILWNVKYSSNVICKCKVFWISLTKWNLQINSASFLTYTFQSNFCTFPQESFYK